MFEKSEEAKELYDTAYCWGHNNYGQLGTTPNNGTANPMPTLVMLPTEG